MIIIILFSKHHDWICIRHNIAQFSGKYLHNFTTILQIKLRLDGVFQIRFDSKENAIFLAIHKIRTAHIFFVNEKKIIRRK